MPRCAGLIATSCFRDAPDSVAQMPALDDGMGVGCGWVLWGRAGDSEGFRG